MDWITPQKQATGGVQDTMACSTGTSSPFSSLSSSSKSGCQRFFATRSHIKIANGNRHKYHADPLRNLVPSWIYMMFQGSSKAYQGHTKRSLVELGYYHDFTALDITASQPSCRSQPSAWQEKELWKVFHYEIRSCLGLNTRWIMNVHRVFFLKKGYVDI